MEDYNQTDDDATYGFELPMMASAISKKYVYFSLEKFWVDIRKRIGTDDFKVGSTLTPPYSEHIYVAVPRKGKDDIEEPVRENAILLNELIELIETYLEAIQTITKG